VFGEGQPPHWIGLLDALGVLLALGLWLVLVDEAWARLRMVAGAAGAVLLLLVTGRALDRLAAFGAALGFPGFFSGPDDGRHLLDLALVSVSFGIGLVAGAYGVSSDDEVAAEPDEEDVTPEPERPPIPARAWSSTEVLGEADALEHGAAAGDADGTEPPRLPRTLDPAAMRGVAVPLLAVAIGLGLPVLSFTTSDRTFTLFGTGAHPGAAGIAAHVLAGLVAGGALLGTAVALDVWERRLAALSFALLAVGVGMHASWPAPFANEVWSVVAIGLAGGLLAPAALRVLRRALRGDRTALVTGGVAALLLVFAASALATYAATQQFRSFNDDAVSFDVNPGAVPPDAGWTEYDGPVGAFEGGP
jgi:hypothetical protein